MGEPVRTATRPTPVSRPGVRASVLLAFPAVAGAVVLVLGDQVDLALGAIVGIGLIALVARSPIPALLALPALLPFQQIVLALLFNLGAPAGAVRGLGFWKEAVTAGLVVAAISKVRATGARLDAIDVVGGVYLANIAIYRLAPGIFTTSGAVPSSATLNLAFRGTTVLVVLFLAGRHLAVGEEVRERFTRVLLITGGVVAAIGILEALFSTWWNTFAVSFIGLPKYQSQILDAVVFNPTDVRIHTVVAGRSVVRIGSVFFSQISCAMFLVLILALALERLARDQGPRWAGALAPVVGVAIVLTQTRAALLAAGLCVLLALRPAPGRDPRARERVAIAVAATLVLMIPFAVSTGLATRAIDTITSRDQSTQEHQGRTGAAIEQLLQHPLGSGLGTTSVVSRRVGTTVSGAAENYYLDLGNETGVQSLLLFVTLSAGAIAVLQRQTRAEGGRPIEAAWRSALVSLTIAALLHPIWVDQLVAWPFWLGVGLAVGPPPTTTRAGAARYPDPPTTQR